MDNSASFLYSKVMGRLGPDQIVKETLLKADFMDDVLSHNLQSAQRYSASANYMLKLQNRIATDVTGDLKFGKVQMTYSNNSL
jgi:hypothetical protein